MKNNMYYAVIKMGGRTIKSGKSESRQVCEAIAKKLSGQWEVVTVEAKKNIG